MKSTFDWASTTRVTAISIENRTFPQYKQLNFNSSTTIRRTNGVKSQSSICLHSCVRERCCKISGFLCKGLWLQCTPRRWIAQVQLNFKFRKYQHFALFCQIFFFLSIISILRWGELESGQTTIAFTPAHQHETDDLTGSVQTFKSGGVRQPVELCFDYPDVDAAYKVYVLDLDVVSRLN